MSTPIDLIHAPGLESVADAFKANFSFEGDDAQISELGAQFSVYKRGVPLIDFKGGWADRAKTTPIDDETLMAVYSQSSRKTEKVKSLSLKPCPTKRACLASQIAAGRLRIGMIGTRLAPLSPRKSLSSRRAVRAAITP